MMPSRFTAKGPEKYYKRVELFRFPTKELLAILT